MFDDKEFIIVEGKIYKKINRRTINVLNDAGITKSVSIRRLIKSIEGDQRYKIDEDIYENFRESIEQGEYIISNYSWDIFKKHASIHERGYINFYITINGITYRTFAHRIIYYLTYGIWDEDKVINHKDNNKQNNKPDNLELITQFENVLYSIKNNEILIHPSMLDDVCRKKYRLNDREWELFKNEVIKAYNRNGEDAHYPLKVLKG